MKDAVGEEIREAWDANAGLWTSAVRGACIASRTAGTDRAIVDAVRRRRPGTVLDVGCGEGWLVRRLLDEPGGCRVVGIDGSEELVRRAAEADGRGTYRVLAYEDLAADPLALAADGPFDVAVCNFALFDERVAPVLAALGRALAPEGALLIQTVHPWSARGDAPYADGWRRETFAAFGAGSWRPMPWYFRTLASWFDEIAAAGLMAAGCEEPADARSGQPLSLILDCRPRRPA